MHACFIWYFKCRSKIYDTAVHGVYSMNLSYYYWIEIWFWVFMVVYLQPQIHTLLIHLLVKKRFCKSYKKYFLRTDDVQETLGVSNLVLSLRSSVRPSVIRSLRKIWISRRCCWNHWKVSAMKFLYHLMDFEINLPNVKLKKDLLERLLFTKYF